MSRLCTAEKNAQGRTGSVTPARLSAGTTGAVQPRLRYDPRQSSPSRSSWLDNFCTSRLLVLALSSLRGYYAATMRPRNTHSRSFAAACKLYHSVRCVEAGLSMLFIFRPMIYPLMHSSCLLGRFSSSLHILLFPYPSYMSSTSIRYLSNRQSYCWLGCCTICT